MARDFNPPNRSLISKVVGGNPEMIKAFEALFKQAGAALPTSQQELEDGLGQTNANVVTLSTALNAAQLGVNSVASHVSNLQTALGSSTLDLGTFTGAIIPDNVTAKVALQSLETKIDDISTSIARLEALIGVAAGAANMGVFSGSLIPVNSTVKAAIQSLETKIDAEHP